MAFKISENTVIDNNENIISSGGASFQQDVTLGSGVGGPNITLSPDGTATFAGISTFSSNIVIEGDSTFAGSATFAGGVGVGDSSNGPYTYLQPTGAVDVIGTHGYLLRHRAVSGGPTLTQLNDDGSATFSGSVHADNFIGSISGSTGNFSGDVTISGNLDMTGSIIPSLDNTYDLGSPTKMWRDVYIGPGSLYVNGQKIVEADDADNIILSASAGQNLVLKPTGLGDLELAPESGIVQVKAALQIQDGTNITNSAGNAVSFSNNISAPSALVNEITSRSTDGDLVLSGSGSGIVRISDSLNVVGSVDASSVKVNGVPVNTSTQVDSKIATAINAIPDVDLSNYDTSSEVDAKIAAIPATDLSSYDTSTQVDSKISTAINAIPDVDLSGYDTSAEVTAKVNALETSLTAGAPGALDTLNELAASLGDDANFASTMTNALATKADSSSLATVATSGSYTDLNNKPSIPTHTSSLVNNSGFITSADGGNAATLDGIDSSQFLRSDANDTVTGQISFQYNDTTGAYKTLEVKGAGDHAGLTINPHSSKQAHLRFATNGSEKWQWRVPFQESSAAAMKLYSWIAADDLYQFNHNGTATFNGGTVWTSANDGSGSGLDADKLDGQEGSHYLNYNNLSNKPSIVSPTGSGASGTWGINITGSANSANTATDADTVDGIHASSFLRLDQDNTITKSLLSFDTNVSDWGFRFQNASGTNNYVYMAHGAYGMHVRNDSSTTNQYLLDVYPSNGNRFQIRGGDGLVTSGGNVMWHAGNDGSGSGLDADLLDGSDSTSFFKSYGSQASGWQNSNANFKVRSGNPSSGLTMSGSDNQFGFQLYGNGGGYYGFLDAEWAGWDIQKQANGPFLVDEGSGLQRVWNAGNDGSGSGLDADLLDGFEASAFVKQNESATLDVLGFTGVGGDSGNGSHSYAIYQAGGAWSNPFPDLIISYHTGIRIGGHYNYGGTRFFSDSPEANGVSELFSVGNGDLNVRVANDLYIGSDNYLQSNGSATFAAGNFNINKNSTGSNFNVRNDSSSVVDAFGVYKGGFTSNDRTVLISNDGSAQFANTLKVQPLSGAEIAGGDALSIRWSDGTQKAIIDGYGNTTLAGTLDTGSTIKSAGSAYFSGGDSYIASGSTFSTDLVIGNGSGTRGMTIYSGTTSEGVVNFADGLSGNDRYKGQIKYRHEYNDYLFNVDYGVATNAVAQIASWGIWSRGSLSAKNGYLYLGDEDVSDGFISARESVGIIIDSNATASENERFYIKTNGSNDLFQVYESGNCYVYGTLQANNYSFSQLQELT